MQPFDTKQFFNRSDYSDVTIRFSGRDIKCHKMVLCRSDYFNRLCGPSSSFKESTAQVVELEEDDPRALEAVLRHIYGDNFLEPALCSDWKFQLEMAKTSCKYLFPELERVALEKFEKLVQGITGASAIFQAITHIRVNGDQPKHLKIADDLETKHIHALLKDKTYRASIEEDRELVWSHMDRLNAIDDLVTVEVAVCSECRGTVMRLPGTLRSRHCPPRYRGHPRYQPECELEDWVECMVPSKIAAKADLYD